MTVEEVLDLSNVEFDPSITFDCGQAFRWRPVNEDRTEWVGVVGTSVIKVTRSHVKRLAGSDNANEIEAYLKNYFSVSDDLEMIKRSFPQDQFLKGAVIQYRGLRLLTQDPWECLISFVCSINCNIPSIKLKIENLSRRFGTEIKVGSQSVLYTFPTPHSLAKAEKRELMECKTGFRWKYIKFLAERVSSGELDLEGLRTMTYEKATNYLISNKSQKTLGIGPKVADCILLYSYHKLEAFPIDVWINRCIKKLYLDTFRIEDWKSLTGKRYSETSSMLRRHFGSYAGYAQQYLFVRFRGDSIHSKNKAGLKGSV